VSLELPPTVPSKCPLRYETAIMNSEAGNQCLRVSTFAPSIPWDSLKPRIELGSDSMAEVMAFAVPRDTKPTSPWSLALRTPLHLADKGSRCAGRRVR
jgi:hypothetical protein